MKSAKKLIIDVHTHVYLPRYMEMMRSRSTVPMIIKNQWNQDRLLILPDEVKMNPSASQGRPIGSEYYDPHVKLAFMKRHDIDFSIVSLANPWLDFLEANEAETLASELNEDIQKLCETHAQFFGFGVLPTASVKGSVSEIQRMSRLSNIKGFIMGTKGLGNGLDDPKLEPVLAEAADRDLTIFLHPHYGIPSSLYGEHDNGHVLPLALGFPFETTIAVSRMILSGVFDRIPNLKLLLAHSGGTLPFLAGRLDSCVAHDHHVNNRLQKKPSDYLKNLYYDAVAYHPPALQCALDLVGPDRLMFGTDHPFFPPVDPNNSDLPWESVLTNLDAISQVGSKNFKSDELENMILGENAALAFGIKAHHQH